MGSRYRKSFKAGPVRITASKSGISYSAGVKGARVTKRADGRVQTTLSVPRAGVSYTKASSSKKAAVRQPVPSKRKPVPQPARLPGRRSTILPVPPPAGTPPLTFNGYLASVTLHPDRIQIDRTRAGQINGNTSAVIDWAQLVGVDFLDPTLLKNGHVHFAIAGDPRGLTSTGNGNRMAATARNPHTIMFTWQQKRRYKQLRSLLTANPAVPARPAFPSSRPHQPCRSPWRDRERTGEVARPVSERCSDGRRIQPGQGHLARSS